MGSGEWRIVGIGCPRVPSIRHSPFTIRRFRRKERPDEQIGRLLQPARALLRGVQLPGRLLGGLLRQGLVGGMASSSARSAKRLSRSSASERFGSVLRLAKALRPSRFSLARALQKALSSPESGLKAASGMPCAS